MYVVLYEDSNKRIITESFAKYEDAMKRVEKINTANNLSNGRVLTDVIDTPYKELYLQLYNDFVKPKEPIEKQPVAPITVEVKPK